MSGLPGITTADHCHGQPQMPTPGRPMTTKDLLNYARGVAFWMSAAAAAAPSPGAPVASPANVPVPLVTEAGSGDSEIAQAHKRPRSDGPYDICPPDLAPSTSYASRAANSHASGRAATKPSSAPDLPPGVVLLKGFLTLDEQVRIVRQIRELGTGPGGFYVPSYSSGGRLALRMMCLGLHWEPRTSKYEQTRSSYDGATPPPIPAGLVELCGRALAAASQASVAAGGGRFPPLQPDICLANFYERSGRLGMHQDKDELPDSLRAGLPVVSLSIGDSADFMYGRTRDVEQASSVRLDSGDLLVFGGPSRMIFHSVAKIHPNSAPPELIRATGMRPGRLNLTFRQYRASG